LLIRVLAVGPGWFGPVDAAESASMILAAGLVGSFAGRFRPDTIVTVGMFGLAVVTILVSGVREIWQLLVLMFVIGWFVSPAQAAIVTILQQGVPDGERGRVMAVFQAAMSAASVLSMAFAGIAGDVVGVSNVFVIAGVIVGLGAIVSIVGYRGTASPIARQVTMEQVRTGADAPGS
jgi:sugar phosphate permease